MSTMKERVRQRIDAGGDPWEIYLELEKEFPITRPSWNYVRMIAREYKQEKEK
jgi:hypothetical protein